MTQKEAGELGGRGNKADDNSENVRSFGNSSKYRIAKLKRDHPEIAQRLMDGEFKSVSEAERAAGMDRPLMSPVEKLVRAYQRLSDDEKKGSMDCD